MKEFISSSYKALVTGLCKHLHTFITHSAIKGYWWCFRVSLAQLLWRSIPNDTGFSEELRTFKVKVQVDDNSRNGIKDPLLVLPKGLRKQDCWAVCCWEIDTHISPGGTARFLLMFWRTYSLKQQPTYSAVLLLVSLLYSASSFGMCSGFTGICTALKILFSETGEACNLKITITKTTILTWLLQDAI